MGVYVYRASQQPSASTPDGIGLHALTFAVKESWGIGSAERDPDTNRTLGPTFRAWERGSPPETCLLAHSAVGKILSGSTVYRASMFAGVVSDVALGRENFPAVGVVVAMPGDGLRIVLRETEAAAWARLGVPWTSAEECLRTTSSNYRPTIDVASEHGFLCAQIYDAVAETLGDERRAFRSATNRRAEVPQAPAIVVQNVTVATTGGLHPDEMEVAAASIPEAQMEMLLQGEPGIVYARNQDGVVIEMMLDMDQESLVARAVEIDGGVARDLDDAPTHEVAADAPADEDAASSPAP